MRAHRVKSERTDIGRVCVTAAKACSARWLGVKRFDYVCERDSTRTRGVMVPFDLCLGVE